MNRRKFLKRLGIGATAAVVAPSVISEEIVEEVQMKANPVSREVNSNFATSLWPGIDQWVSDHYTKHEDSLKFKNLF